LYGTLAYLWLRFFYASGKRIKQVIFYSLLLVICYGCFDEFHTIPKELAINVGVVQVCFSSIDNKNEYKVIY